MQWSQLRDSASQWVSRTMFAMESVNWDLSGKSSGEFSIRKWLDAIFTLKMLPSLLRGEWLYSTRVKKCETAYHTIAVVQRKSSSEKELAACWGRASQIAQWSRTHLPMKEIQEKPVQSLGQEDTLGKEMATHSSILARKTPWTEESGRLQLMGPQRVGHGSG